jgi:hypothetical protein
MVENGLIFTPPGIERDRIERLRTNLRALAIPGDK